jgi:hypothetical protein
MGKPSIEIILKAINGSGGVMSTIAKRLKVEWHTAQSYVNSSEETKQAYQNEEEWILDIADAKLYDNVKQGDLAAIKWLKATKGKKRGYVEKQDIGFTDKNGDDVPINRLPTDKLSQLEKLLNDITTENK